jgi:hypothetical protein
VSQFRHSLIERSAFLLCLVEILLEHCTKNRGRLTKKVAQVACSQKGGVGGTRAEIVESAVRSQHVLQLLLLGVEHLQRVGELGLLLLELLLIEVRVGKQLPDPVRRVLVGQHDEMLADERY